MAFRARFIPALIALACIAWAPPRAAAQDAQDQPEAPAQPPLRQELAPLAERLAALERELADLEARGAGVDALRSDIGTREIRVDALDAEVRARAAEGGGGLQIGSVLRRAKASLPSPPELRTAARALSREAVRDDDRLFELQETRGRIPSSRDRVRAYVRDELGVAAPDEETLAQAAAMGQRIDSAAGALIEALAGTDGLIQRLQELAGAETALAQKSDALASFINERVLWVRSDPPIRAPQARAFVRGTLALAEPTRWKAFVAAVARAGWVGASGTLIVAIIALGVARYWAGRRLHYVLLHAGDPGRARLRHSFEGIALLTLRCAFWPGLMWALSRIVSGLAAEGAGRLAPAIGAGLSHAAGAVFVGSLLRALAAPQGLGETQLHWRPSTMAAARNHLAWFVPALGALLGLLGFTEFLADDAETRLLPRVIFIALALSLAAFVALALRPGGRLMRELAGRVGPAVRVAYFGVILAFIAVAVMTFMGWFFSAEALFVRLRDSAAVVGAVLLVRALALRWLSLSVAQAHAAQVAREADEARTLSATADPRGEVAGAPPLIEPRRAVDLALVRGQVRTLTTIVAALVCVVALAPIWSDVIPALARLDSVGLIPFGGVDAPALRSTGAFVLTLRDVLKSLVILGLGMAALRTLPPMIDGLVLSRTGLDSGARFAAVTIAKYGILGVSVFLVLGALHTKWGSVGWVLGGLSVGLGFGMQEFFGNFIAGLSLLFERTIRPGDRVQVGEFVGVVKEITIRATTLADARRRDVIVPNRLILSGIVVNETRTDRTGVAEFTIGVAYGSDTTLVRRLLIDACERHPEVVDAIANFDSFGDNALNFKVSASVREITRRAEVVNDLLTAIDEAFRDRAIEVSFPQRDLHVRGGEITVRVTEAPAHEPAEEG